MILTVTSNVALDRTYVVDHVELGAVHKVRTAFAQTGGKGVNVSRTLAALGCATAVTGLIGRAGLAEAQLELEAAGVAPSLYTVDGPPRHTVTVTSRDDGTTAFYEPGPTVTGGEWQGFEEHVGGLLPGADMVVIAGSLPPGAPADALERLVASAHAMDVPVLVDASGAAMQTALRGRPTVAKLNRDELGETLGRECLGDRDVIEGAQHLRSAGARSVIVTLGSEGVIALDGPDCLRVRHPARAGNPIGAGDAFSAGFAAAITASRPFRVALREGAAGALGSLRSPIAGQVDPEDVRMAASEIETELVERVASQL